MRQLIEDLISMMEYHVEQTRPTHTTTVALQAAREALKSLPAPVQEPVQPVYKDSTPHLHVGDSAFESWFSKYNPAGKGDKQRARDAYAAGMGDQLVAPAAQRQWSGLTDEEFEDIELGCRSTLFGKIEAMRKVEAKLRSKNT